MKAHDLSPTTPGLLEARTLDLEVPPPLRVCLIRFDSAGFQARAFHDHDLTLPPELARSVRRRQADFFFGRMAVRMAARSQGIVLNDPGIGSARQPLWPADLCGSISHSAGYAVAAVADLRAVRGCGVDVERLVDPAALDAVLQIAASPPEWTRVRSMIGDESGRLATTLVFSAKESLFKAVFDLAGRHFEFSAVRVVDVDPTARTMTLQVLEPLAPALPAGRQFIARYRWLDGEHLLTSVVDAVATADPARRPVPDGPCIMREEAL